jgi:hypothetical protein
MSSSDGLAVEARVTPDLTARVVARRTLLYARGADAALDRPLHVRAGSALVRLDGGMLAVVQDDASFVALVDPKLGGEVFDVPLPAEDGVRQFDDARGNKHAKLDLEACIAMDGLLVAFGSGSSPLRERVVVLAASWAKESAASATPAATRTTIVTATELYASMRAEPAFSGSELNIEGAVVRGADVLFFQRGNGAPDPVRGLSAVNATARVDRAGLVAYLRARGDAPCPPLRDVVRWELPAPPEVSGRLSFTDAARSPRGGLAFLACAEDSPDATKDGPVSAVTIGRLDDRARTAELALVLDERGAPLLDKAEGLAFDPSEPSRAWVVVDKDDPDAASELLELRLGPAWAGAR